MSSVASSLTCPHLARQNALLLVSPRSLSPPPSSSSPEQSSPRPRPVLTMQDAYDAAALTTSRRDHPSSPSSSPQDIITDRRILAFFCQTPSSVFVPWLTARRAFHDLILPLVRSDQASLPCLLALAGALMLRTSADQLVQLRSAAHYSAAIAMIGGCGNTPLQTVAARAMLLFLRSSVLEGGSPELASASRVHWNALARIVHEHSRELPNDSLTSLMFEFVAYHGLSQLLISELAQPAAATALPADLLPSHSCSVFDVVHSFSAIFCRIHALRGRTRHVRRGSQSSTTSNSSGALLASAMSATSIRPGSSEGIEDTVEALRLDAALRTWDFPSTVTESEEVRTLGHLWRASCWVYLARAASISGRGQQLSARVNTALAFVKDVLAGNSCCSGLLIMPLFLIGCSAFDESQRRQVTAAYDQVYRWKPWGCVAQGRSIVTRVWALIDAGDKASWDWEMVARGLGDDLVIA